MIVGLVATSFNQAWSPFLFRKLTENDARSRVRIVKFTYIYMAAIAIFALVLSVAAPWFLAFFVGPEFRGAYQYVFWVALGYAANGMYLMVAHYIFFAKKTHLLAVVTLVSAIVNVLLNYFLIRAHGPIGAAQASAASFFVSFVLTWILAARVYDMPWRVWRAEQP
jgi:O-antigen/teichoic acid export membrane protein